MRHPTLYCLTNCHFDVLLSTDSITHFWKRHTMNTQNIPEIPTFYWDQRDIEVFRFLILKDITLNAMIQGKWSIKLKTQQCKIKKTMWSRKFSFKLGRTSLSNRYKILCKEKILKELSLQKKLTLIRPVVFKLEYLFWQEK